MVDESDEGGERPMQCKGKGNKCNNNATATKTWLSHCRRSQMTGEDEGRGRGQSEMAHETTRAMMAGGDEGRRGKQVQMGERRAKQRVKTITQQLCYHSCHFVFVFVIRWLATPRYDTYRYKYIGSINASAVASSGILHYNLMFSTSI